MIMFGFGKEDKNNVEFKFFKGLSASYEQVIKNNKGFILLSTILCLLLSLVDFLSGNVVGCIYSEYYLVSYCSYGFVGSLAKFLFGIFAYSIFISRWQMLAYQHKPMNEVLIKRFTKQDLKAFGLILFYFISFIVISMITYYLSSRVVMDNAAFEVMLYISLSSIIIVFVVLLMLAFLWVRFFDGKEWLCFSKSLMIVYDSLYKIFGWFFVYIVLMLLWTRLVYMLAYISLDGIFSSIIAEFCFNYFVCLLVVGVQGVINYQNRVVFGEE